MLGFGLPSLLFRAGHIPHGVFGGSSTGVLDFAILLCLLTTASLYVSSLGRSGLQALLVALPVVLGLILYTEWLSKELSRLITLVVGDSRLYRVDKQVIARHVRVYRTSLGIITTAAAFIVLRFASENHRFQGIDIRRRVVQAFWIVACVTVGMTILMTISALYRLWFLR